jgi:predicted CoA-substrate-specific enzyme activase
VPLGVGIDLGTLALKVAVVRDGTLVATATVPTGRGGVESAARTVAAALERAGASSGEHRIVIADRGGEAIPLEGTRVPAPLCSARGTLHCFPTALTVVDLGAENTCVVSCSTDGRVLGFDLNSRCAAGTGLFIDTIAKALGIAIEEVGAASLAAQEEIAITATCSVFAESEVVGLIARGADKASILRGVHRSIASRVYTQLVRVGVRDDVVFTGGGALNEGLRRAIEERLGRPLMVPDEPRLTTAVGAALIAGGMG